MDKKSKVVIVVLVLIGVVFAFGLGTNLLPKQGEPEGGKKADKQQQKQSVEAYNKNGWIGSMDKLMSRFSPQLDVRRLQGPKPGVPCSMDKDVLELFANNAGCQLTILPRLRRCDDDYESVTLTLVKDATATRDAAARFKLNPALMQAQHLKRYKLKMATIPPKLVMYQPAGESKFEPVEERDGEFRLVVLKQGGTLKFECTSCSRNRPVTLFFATRESCDD